MAEAKFVLKEPNGTGKTLIYLFYNFDNQRLKYSTGEKIYPKFWNKKRQRAKETKEFPEYFELNARLDNFETAANNGFRRLKNDKVVLNPYNLKKEIEGLLQIAPYVKKSNLVSFIKSYIEEVLNNKRPATISVYKTTLKHLMSFSSEKNVPVDFENITLSFYNAFTSYLSEDKGYLNNTIGKYIRVLKALLNEATERGANSQLDFRSKKFKALKEDTEQIYLNELELGQLKKIDLSDNIRLKNVRDLFLIGCYTGLRFSDLSKITKSDIDFEKRILKVKTLKTGQLVSIPLRKIVIEILAEYEYTIPKPISNQKMNKYLKELGEKADMIAAVSITKTSGNKLNRVDFKKYELITTHTARRSFATNAYLAKVPTLAIMKLTGHKTEKSFMQYIRITEQENASMMLEHAHFNQ